MVKQIFAFYSSLSLVQRFMVFSFLVVLVGALFIGRWTSSELESDVVDNARDITALYVNSAIAPHLQEIDEGKIAPENYDYLDRLLAGPLGQGIMAFKVWSKDGRVLYATDRRLVNMTFPVTSDLSQALAGRMVSRLSSLKEEEDQRERERWRQLIETHVPVRRYASDEVIGAVEFYQSSEALDAELAKARWGSWTIVALAGLVLYLTLVAMVRQASNTIVDQNRRLRELAQRVRQVGLQKTQTDEIVLQRIARDIHDGAAQDLSCALLRIETLKRELEAQAKTHEQKQEVTEDLQMVHTALASALKELRELSSGLALPDLQALTLGQVAERAQMDHERKWGQKAALTLGALPAGSPDQKTAVYRLLQEALNNAHFHSQATEVKARLFAQDGWIHLEVVDNGLGLPADALEQKGAFSYHLGLRGMRERAELLGGAVDVSSQQGRGTTVRVRIPVE